MTFFKKKRRRIEEALAKGPGREQGKSYWHIVKKQFRKNRMGVWSIRILTSLIILALTSDFIANDKPIYCKYNGENYFPVFKEYAIDLGLAKWHPDFLNADWKELEFDRKLLPLIPYSPNDLDFKNAHFKGPFDEQNVEHMRYWHWMGTDELGRDVASGMLHGIKTALLVGIVAMSVASLLGLLFGTFAGFFGDNGLRMSYPRIVLNLIGVGIAWFYAFMVRSYSIAESSNKGFEIMKSILLFVLIMSIINGIAGLLEKLPLFQKRVAIPLDLLIMRLIETVNSIPGMLLLIAALAIIERPSIVYVMIIIGLISWTNIARFIRAELLRIRSLEYVEAAQALGFSKWRVLFKHAIPNALTPVLITIAFGIAASILLEASLSFLGIGVPIDQVTWGSLLTEARKNASAWWLALFPGLAIFITVTLFNLIGDGLTEAMDPTVRRLK